METKETKFKKPTKFKKIRKWQPDEWEGEYEKITFESCLGVSNTDLAKKYSFTPQHISNILNTEQARQIKAQYVAAIRQGSLDLMEKQYGEIVTKSVENIHTILGNDTLREKNPYSHFHASITALKGLGKLQEEAKAGVVNNTQINNTMIINSTQESKIIAGLDKLEQIKLLHGEVNGDSVK
jgi:tRNA(Arg) A34 adenosine deaminase TadA